MTSNYDILQKAERLELLTADLYAELARHFCTDLTALDTFTRLHEEEKQHATRVRMVMTQARQDPKLLAKIDVDARGLDGLLQEVSAMVAELRSRSWGANLAQTIRLIEELEERTGRVHEDGLKGLHASLRAFFEQLAQQDRAHRALLRRGPAGK